MTEWKPQMESQLNGEKQIGPLYTSNGNGTYKTKSILRSPSTRAMRNYNNLSIIDHNCFEKLNFLPENENYDSLKYEELYANSNSSVFADSMGSHVYDSMRSSIGHPASSTQSELGSVLNEMGSTVKLVPSKLERTCQTWFSHIHTVLCTIALAAGFGNLYRLPQVALANGGLPFLLVYIFLTLIIGLPLLFLEIGIGQLAEEGFIKSWRAVPFFKGIGYVKLIAGCLLNIYYSLYMGLSLFYIIWIAKGTLPFQECAVVKIKETGYSAESIDRQLCLSNTFLESPFKNPFWYGIYASLLLVIWSIVILLCSRRTKSFTTSLLVLLFPTLICFIALLVKTILVANHKDGLNKLTNDTKWDNLYSSNVWYYATIQVFISTNIGFGSFITNAGIMYNKGNPLWIALGYITASLLFGVGSTIMCYILTGTFNISYNDEHILELHLKTLIYDVAVNSKDKNAKSWVLVVYAALLFVGFISMVTITYTLLKVITVQSKRRLKWWQANIILSFFGFLVGCGILLKENFQLVHLLDEYIIGNLILICVIIEVFALVTFYGTERIKCDFEFMLGHVLSKIWLISWWIIPILLTAIFAWGLSTLPFGNDPQWLSGIGWAFILVATIFIFVIGFYTITKQEAYTFIDKLKTSFKPSNDWGPKDPMLRYAWMQWCTKIKEGERDFTLKRRGTRDYTRSIKKTAKKQIAQTASEMSTVKLSPLYPNNRDSIDENPNYRSSFYLNDLDENSHHKNSERITPSSGESLMYPIDVQLKISGKIRSSHDNGINPVSNCEAIDGANSDGYGTFRKGPYVINDNNVGHVCHKKFNQSEDATEL